MKTLGLLFLSLIAITPSSYAVSDAFLAPSKPAPRKILTAASGMKLEFKYASFDGTWSHPCKSALLYEDNPYDYSVKCYDGAKLVRTFNVHLAISVYPGASSMSIETLYWVNGEGATSWVHLKDKTALMGFESSQSITGEPASLRMKVSLQ